jgi:RNA polymerase sigma factor (sigma-70 family)
MDFGQKMPCCANYRKSLKQGADSGDLSANQKPTRPMPLSAALLAELIDSQAASLRLWVRSRCGSPDDAVQEAFCQLAVQNPPPANPVAWLYGAARNIALKQRRTDQRRQQREQAHALQVHQRSIRSDALQLAEMLQAVDRLDNELRELLVARIWGHLSFDEIGGLCGVSAATAFRRYQEALKQLRTALDEDRQSSKAS